MNNKPAVILGAGPAGIATAYELIKQGVQPIVLEKADKVGGIARTETYKDYYFDIGGHRFFTKIDQVNKLWHEMLGKDFQKVRRMSSIYYEGRLFNHPLSISNALFNLGILESLLVMLSYFNAQFNPYREEKTFEQWVSNRFGRRLGLPGLEVMNPCCVDYLRATITSAFGDTCSIRVGKYPKPPALSPDYLLIKAINNKKNIYEEF